MSHYPSHSVQPQYGYGPSTRCNQPGAYPQQGGYDYPGGYGQSGGYTQPGDFNQSGGYGQPGRCGQPGGQPKHHTYHGELDETDTEHDDVHNTTAFKFTEQSIRRAFIRKVYCILSVQLVVTMLLMCIFMFVQSIRNYVRKNAWVYIVSMVLAFVLMIVIACFSSMRRNFPLNFILLAAFTVVEGVMLGCIAAHYQTNQVLMAAGITAVVTVGLTIFSFQTKWDFTYLSGILFVLTIVLFCFGILLIFFYSKIAHMIYACLGALLFSVYLVVDTQLMMGGKHQYSLSPEEYIFAALNLYIDIINLFIFILSIIGLGGDL